MYGLVFFMPTDEFIAKRAISPPTHVLDVSRPPWPPDISSFNASHSVSAFFRSVSTLFLRLDFFPIHRTAESRANTHVDWKKLLPAMQPNWDVAVRELLAAVQFDMCPYFYLVTHQWTALIMAQRVTREKTLRAFIGPTAMGFRRMLKEKGIDFEMPLRTGKNSTTFDGKDQDE